MRYLRLVALREGDRIQEALATENERKCLYARLRKYIQAAKLLAAGESLQPTHSQPALRTGLMAPVWRRALCVRDVILDLSAPRGVSRSSLRGTPLVSMGLGGLALTFTVCHSLGKSGLLLGGSASLFGSLCRIRGWSSRDVSLSVRVSIAGSAVVMGSHHR